MNLTLLFDGTWNDPQDRTNVFRLCTSLADHAKDRGRHIRKYDTDPDGHPAVNVTVDSSVWERYTQDPTYRPRTLVNKGLKPPITTISEA
jgi:uncharacterized protein (DUF2235 family)